MMVMGPPVGDEPNHAWCEYHWARVRRATDDERPANGIGVTLYFFEAIFLCEEFRLRCVPEGEQLADPSLAKQVMSEDPFSPLCCYFGDEKLDAWIEMSRSDLPKGVKEIG